MVVLVASCTTNSLQPKGGACFQSIDCQLPLVCIPTPGADAGGTCSDDLSKIVSLPEAGANDAPVTSDGGDGAVTPDTGPADNNVPDNNPPPDTGTQDTGTQDTGGSDAPID